MPVHVEKRKGKYVIVEDSTGEVVGHSHNRKDAETSARIRNEAHKRKKDK